MMPQRRVWYFLSFVCVLTIAFNLQATDDASQPAYSGGWTNGSNGGTQFLPWSLVPTGPSTNSGFFIGDSNTNAFGTGPGINSGTGVAWGTYANSSNSSIAIRPFVTPLTPGNTFGVQIDNGFIDNGSSVGFSLSDSSNSVRFSFRFTGGGSNYSISDATGTFNTSLGFLGTGLNTALDLVNPTTYLFTVTDISNGNTYQHVGPLVAGGAIDRFVGFNINAGSGIANEAYFNRMTIAPVPEPASVLLICGLAGGALTMLRRRRQLRMRAAESR
jgi:hypothetical protein